MIDIIQADQFLKKGLDQLFVDTSVIQPVSEIISAVRKDGDKALIDYTLRFDKVQIESVRISPERLKAAEETIPAETRVIIEKALNNIRKFHENQVSVSWEVREENGTVLGELVRSLDRVGIYIPGGKAFYPSSLIMNAVPAQIAGVPSIAVVSPPGENGYPHHLVLGICSLMGINEVHSVGGAQAIAALAYGTESVSPVCKITGPGNRYVAEAKRQVFGTVGIDSVAGPSEILILHDDPDIPAEYITRDLLTQAEHDEEARAMLITTCEATAKAVCNRLNDLIPNLPRREIITESLRNKGKIILVDTIDAGIELVNQIAPEHLEVLIQNEEKLSEIRNAGAIFVGKWSTETIGDYFAGPNHTIPTAGAARYGSPLSVRDFQKHSSLIKYSQRKLAEEGEIIARFAELEELHAHAAAVRARLKKE